MAPKGLIVRDLQHRFHVDGRTFVIKVSHRCNPVGASAKIQ
jgi:hypothetical protein